MSLRKDYDGDSYSFNEYDYPHEEDEKELSHKRRVRKMLEERLEKKRLREEFDELDGEFDWDEFEK